MQQLLRKQIKASIWRLCKTLGADKRLLQGKAAVLGFHRVIPSQGFNGLNCSPDFFEQLCIFLKKSFRVAPLLELSRSLESGSVERFQVAITFDDGYLDNFENAAPILRRHGLPATFFLTTDFIGSDTPAFWDADAGEEHPFMTWPHAEQLLEQGFDIGSHTCSHANLGKLPHDAAVQEISNAKAILEDKLGTSVSNFAYPFGVLWTSPTPRSRLSRKRATPPAAASSVG